MLLRGLLRRTGWRVGVDRHAASGELAYDQLGTRIALICEESRLAGDGIERTAQLAGILELAGLVALHRDQGLLFVDQLIALECGLGVAKLRQAHKLRCYRVA